MLQNVMTILWVAKGNVTKESISNENMWENMQTFVRWNHAVTCVFFDSDCLTTLPRKDITEHMESNARVHLLYCLGAQQKLAEKLSELKLSHEKLQNDHKNLKEECQRMKISISGILDSHVQQQSTSSTSACASCKSTSVHQLYREVHS